MSSLITFPAAKMEAVRRRKTKSLISSPFASSSTFFFQLPSAFFTAPVSPPPSPLTSPSLALHGRISGRVDGKMDEGQAADRQKSELMRQIALFTVVRGITGRLPILILPSSNLLRISVPAAK